MISTESMPQVGSQCCPVRMYTAEPTVTTAAIAATGASFSPRWNARILDMTGTMPSSTKLVVAAITRYAAAKPIAVQEKLFGPLVRPFDRDGALCIVGYG